MSRTGRVVVAGAATLMGKELNEALGESPLAAMDFVLLDEEELAGKLETAGSGDVTFVQKLTAESFAGAEYVFLAGDAATTHANAKPATESGAAVVDLSGALEATSGVPVRAPWVAEMLGAPAGAIDLRTPAVVSAEPAAVMLATVLAQLQQTRKVKAATATVLVPASQFGRAALDELHQQALALMSFQTAPKEEFDGQAAFNVTPEMGAESKVRLAEAEGRIRRHLAAIAGDALPEPAVQVAMASTFHGVVASVLVELGEPLGEDEMKAALDGERVDVLLDANDPPNNLSVAGQANIQVRVRREGEDGRRWWLWAAADNLRLAAANAIACAGELGRLKPKGQVQ